jgi:D-aspartate ligase
MVRTEALWGAGRPGALVIGGHFQGLGILRSLGRHHIPTHLIDTGLCISRFSRYVDRFAKCPDVGRENEFLEFLVDLAGKERLNGWVVYPNDDETVRFLARHKTLLEKHYRLITPSWDVVKFAYDKRLTYELAQKCGVATPRTFCVSDPGELEQLEIGFPAIIKPAIKEPFYSKTKRKAIRVNDRRQLQEEFAGAGRLIDDTRLLMVQELIPGAPQNLFSVGSLFRDGRMLAGVVARRPRQHPMDFGHATTYAETVHIPELEKRTRTVLSAMGYYGLSEVEFMLDPRDGEYKLIEINARPWGWHTLAIGAGVDLPYLTYQDSLGIRTEANGFAAGVKWIRLTTDIPTVARELFRGRMEFSHYLDSLKGKKEFAVLSGSDMLPFMAELVLLPYLWMKRGF